MQVLKIVSKINTFCNILLKSEFQYDDTINLLCSDLPVHVLLGPVKSTVTSPCSWISNFLTSSHLNHFFLRGEGGLISFFDEAVIVLSVVTRAGSGNSKVLFQSARGEVITVTFKNAAA